MDRPLDKLVYTPKEAAEILGVSLEAVYGFLAKGVLKGVQFGGTTLVPAWTIERYLGKRGVPKEDPEAEV